MSDTSIFVTISLFWLVLFVIFGMIGYSLEVQEDFNTGLGEDKLEANSFSISNLGSGLTFIFRVMLWSLPPNISVPGWVSLFLDTFALYSIYIFIKWVRGV